MAMYIITGKLGGGKSLVALKFMEKYLARGKRVATNIDLFPEFFLSYKNKSLITRVPDKPRLEDLEALGMGDDKSFDEYDESTFGALVLDELGSVFNSRDSRNKQRAALLNWFTNPRKMHWDVYLIIHDIAMLDSQLRGILAEHVVYCKRMDRLTVPFFSALFKLFTGKSINLPKIHMALVKYGQGETAPIVDRIWFYGKYFYKGYHTGQVFRDDIMYTNEGEAIDMRASFSILPPWLVYGRYLPKPKSFFNRILNYFFRLISRQGKERSGVTANDKLNEIKIKSYLVDTICNEEKPLLINPDNLYLFPEVLKSGKVFSEFDFVTVGSDS